MTMNNKSTKRGNKHEPEKFPTEPTVIQVVKTGRGVMNHSYRDFSKVPPTADYEHPKEIKDMTFAQKVHHILSQPDYEKWISWMPHGRAFKVHVPVMFEGQICPKYFDHKRYSSFLRELNNYGFKHISKGTDRNCYYHEFILKDRPHLCQYMPPCKDARRLVADPNNEPNLYRISREFPLDGEAPAKDALELPAAKRARTDVAGAATLGAPGMFMGQPGMGLLGASAPAALLGAAPAPVNPQTAALLNLLEAQNKKREEEKQRALLAAALLQQQQQQPQQMQPQQQNLAAVLSLFGGQP